MVILTFSAVIYASLILNVSSWPMETPVKSYKGSFMLLSHRRTDLYILNDIPVTAPTLQWDLMLGWMLCNTSSNDAPQWAQTNWSRMDLHLSFAAVLLTFTSCPNSSQLFCWRGNIINMSVIPYQLEM